MFFTKIILPLLSCSLLFVAAFILCSYLAVKLFFEHLSFVGLGGSTPFKPHEAVMFWLCIAGVVASFGIHPYGAYLIRDDIHRLASSAVFKNITFIVFAGFQIVLLAFACGTFASKNLIVRHRQISRGRTHQAVIAVLDSAKVEVVSKHAKVISDDGKFVLAEVTLQIKNVPLSIPYYEMNIHGVGGDRQFFTAFVRESNQSIRNPALKAVNKDNKWMFYDLFTKQEISDNPDNVVLRFEFSRVKADRNQLPKTITPRLGIWARDDKVYHSDYQFFHKPIPVSFKR